MKRIAIFCDGTWNKHNTPFQTNIVKLWQCLAPSDGATEQVAIYIPGVGLSDGENEPQIGAYEDRKTGATQSRFDKFAEFLAKFGGGAFGWGLDEKVLTAYRYLAEVYEPGDEVYVFGFSRGAYTARTLIGLIRNCGVLSEPTEERLQFAIGLYRSRLDYFSPNSFRMRRMREWLSPKVAISDWDKEGRASPKKVQVFDIKYLGLFDTVGALGVPGVLSALSSVFNRKYRFHDTKISKMVRSARHAICIDDERVTYPPTLFDPDKLDELNKGGDLSDLKYRECWFPSEHGMVGGGALENERGLANATLIWIAEGAQKQGLVFDAGKLKAFELAIDAKGPLRTNASPISKVDQLTMKLRPYHRIARPRDYELSDIARQRWMEVPDYNPKTLHRRAKALGWPIKGDD